MTSHRMLRLALVAGAALVAPLTARAQFAAKGAAARAAAASDAHTAAMSGAPVTATPAVDRDARRPVAAPGARATVPAPEPVAVARVPRAAAASPKTAAKAASPTPAAASAPAARPSRAPLPDTVTIERERFSYGGVGRRDPFRSLLTTPALRPLPSELRLVAVAYDPSGAASVAILRDITTKEQHRVRYGSLLGRMRVAQIRPKAVVFTVEELGYSRQEILALNDSSAVRGK